MKKKGFTLVELLAVIVILAIIALIAVPQVLNMIEKARIGSAEDSAYSYVNVLENKLAENILKKKVYVEGIYNVGDIEEEIKGYKPSSGTFTLDKSNIVIEAKLCINNYPIYYNGKTAVYNKDGDYCIPAKKTLLLSSTDVEIKKDNDVIGEIKIRENEEEIVDIKTSPDKYIESVTCTAGFEIKNLNVGPSSSSTQTITIKSTNSEDGTCEFKTHIRWYDASSYNASCTSYYGNGCIKFEDCDDPDGNGGYVSQAHCNYWWGRYTGHGSDTEPCTSADIFYSCSCPSGGKLSGSKCYSCPDGGTLDGTLCKY